MTVSLSRLFSFSSVYSKAMPLLPDIPVPDYTRKQQFLRTGRPAASIWMAMPLAADSGLWRVVLFQCLSRKPGWHTVRQDSLPGSYAGRYDVSIRSSLGPGNAPKISLFCTKTIPYIPTAPSA